MDMTHGRKGQHNEYFEIRLDDPCMNVVAQKSGEVWITYIVEREKDGSVRTVEVFDDEEKSKTALTTMAYTLTQFKTM